MAGVGYIVLRRGRHRGPGGHVRRTSTRGWPRRRARLRDWSIDSESAGGAHHPRRASAQREGLHATPSRRSSSSSRSDARVGAHRRDRPRLPLRPLAARATSARRSARQLALAKRLELPVVVHLREAHDEGYAILEEIGRARGAAASCTASRDGPEVAERFLELGCHISFAGPVTFKKADAIREAAKLVPLDRLLVETDCPFLAPEPYRGRTNEPAWVDAHRRDASPRSRAMPPAELAPRRSANARRALRRGREAVTRARSSSGIAGSPRRHGNSEQLLDACLAGVADAGGDGATSSSVVEYGIAPCRGCNACSLTGECVIVDRMQRGLPARSTPPTRSSSRARCSSRRCPPSSRRSTTAASRTGRAATCWASRRPRASGPARCCSRGRGRPVRLRARPSSRRRASSPCSASRMTPSCGRRASTPRATSGGIPTRWRDARARRRAARGAAAARLAALAAGAVRDDSWRPARLCGRFRVRL